MSRVRRSIISHPGLQALAFVALVCLYIWRVDPVASTPFRILSFVILTALPVCSNLLHRDHVRDLGIRVDNLRDSVRTVGVVTLIGSLAVVALGAAFGWRSTLNLG